ncbi:MAG: D-alanine--D-alanine ligase [Bacteroidia bacterium]|nr:D-alanine--D-alanine ligase [Bacteroidia bacterium]
MKTPKWLKWEFLPWKYFYFPVYIYYLILSLKEGSMGWIAAVNPQLPLGGMADTSKNSLLVHFQKNLIPSSILIDKKLSDLELKEKLIASDLTFPLIAKPDRMERGLGVELVKDISALNKYNQKNKFEYLIQEYIDYPIELGILYYRYPDSSVGEITSIVQKGFLKIIGDGNSKVKELLKKHPRAGYFKKHIEKQWSAKMDHVLALDEELLLEPIGNHNRGTTFHNANDLINEALVRVFDNICKQVPDFYYGRFDIRVPSLEDLYAGQNIKIIELNGSNSEPAHIYDPEYSLFRAYKDLLFHYKIMFRIARINHRVNSVKYISAMEGFRILRYAEGNRNILRATR